MHLLHRIAVAAVVAWVINLLAFFFITGRHGDAFGGKVEDGRYYVGSHARYTEVSEIFWRMNAVHSMTVLVTSAVGVTAAAFLVWQSRRGSHG